MTENRFVLLQINDSLFPIGGYSHSYGLETYIQKGLVADEHQAMTYLQNNLKYNLCYNEFLGAKLAYDYGQAEDMDGLTQLAIIMDAAKTPSEIRTASYKLGSRFVKSIRAMDVKIEKPIFQDYIQSGVIHKKHYALLYGLFSACVGIEYTDMIETFIYAQTSAMVTNCVKTIPLSQTVGQKILFQCQPVYREIVNQLKNLIIEDYGISTPGFDIRCMQHEALYSRIYMS